MDKTIEKELTEIRDIILEWKQGEQSTIDVDELLSKLDKLLPGDDNKDEGPLVIWSHSCSGSSKHHINKYKHYAKAISNVDTSVTKPTGYAIEGEFLESPVAYDENQVKIPGDTVVLEVCDQGETVIYKANNRENILYSYRGRLTFEDLEAIKQIVDGTYQEVD